MCLHLQFNIKSVNPNFLRMINLKKIDPQHIFQQMNIQTMIITPNNHIKIERVSINTTLFITMKDPDKLSI